MGSISEAVVSEHTIDHQMLIGVQTGLSPRYFTTVALFSVSYPAILPGPNAGLDLIQHSTFVDFGAMRTFDEWYEGDAHHGLAVTLTKNMRYELMVLQCHIQARLGNNPEAQDLYLKIITATMDLWESYVPMFTGFCNKLLTNFCEGGNFSKA